MTISNARMLVVALHIAAQACHAVPAAAAGTTRLGQLPASYSGVLPCADCAGIRYQLNLLPRGAFMLALSYLRNDHDATYYELGAYNFSPDSSVLTLSTNDPSYAQFAVKAQGVLRKLDREGRVIESQLNYELRREPAFIPLEPRLAMRGEYLWYADAPSFTECLSGLRWPVASGPAAYQLEMAQHAYTAAGADATSRPLVVSVQARVALHPPPNTEGDLPTLFIERVFDTFPGERCGERGVVASLEGTRWVPTRIGMRLVQPTAQQREPFMSLDTRALRVTGFTGCNRLNGSITRGKAGSDSLAFGPAAMTRMACPGADSLETPFLQALTTVRRFRIAGSHLELLDVTGAVAARFEARDVR